MHGSLSHAAAVVWSDEVASDSIDATNQGPRGMRASAVQRCTRHSFNPSRALPRWRTRRSIVSSRSAVAFDNEVSGIACLLEKHVKPGDDGQQRGHDEDDDAVAVGVANLEAVSGVPGQMPESAAQVIEECRRPQEQQQHTNG